MILRVTVPDVSVTGLGMVTPAGDGWQATWERVCEGLPTAALGPPAPVAHLACTVADFDPARLGRARSRRPDRCTQLALLAAREALSDAGLEPARWDGTRVAVIVGSSSGGIGTLESEHRALLGEGAQEMSPYAVPASLGNSVSAQLTIELGAMGPSHTVNTACASGATAIGTALDLLALGRCDIALVGGADATITPYNIAGFDRVGALSHRFDDPAGALRPFDARRDGFVMGEGAGMLVLERTADARARGARARARSGVRCLVGRSPRGEAQHRRCRAGAGAARGTRPRGRIGAGRLAHQRPWHRHAHGRPGRSGRAGRAVPPPPPVTSTKAVTGHLMGAAGAVEAALTVLAVEQGLVPPTANLDDLDPAVALDIPTKCREGRLPLALSVSTGFGGQNAVLAITPD